MVDVFISYTRPERLIAQKLHDLLTEEGWEVWFDEEIYAGAQWEALLDQTLADAKAVVVLWSPLSVQSTWVLREARVAAITGKLVPVMIEQCPLPDEFQGVQYTQLFGWSGGPHPGLERVFAGLTRHAPPSRIDTVRPGFDSTFLGPDVGLPAITGVGEEFRYLHFSVVMNPARRLAWYVAYNMASLIGERPQREDSWQPDPLLPRAFQPQNDHFRGTGYDRGHLARPTAVTWGEYRLASIAQRQSFFWTNTSPQHQQMNRSWWLDLETWEGRVTTDRGKAIGFSGPVLHDDDPLHVDVQTTVGRLVARQTFRLPRAFWKVVVAPRADGALELASFRLDQDALVRDKVTRIDPERWRVPLEALEQETGIEFSPIVRSAATRPLR